MLQTGILNPHVLELVARIRHTNTLVIADWAFPFWPQVEDFLSTNPPESVDRFDEAFAGFSDATVERLPHVTFKTRVPNAIGLI